MRTKGRAFSYTLLRLPPPFSPTKASPGASLLVHPPSYCAHHLLHIDETGAQHPLTLTRASEGRRPESESKSLICEPPGASLRIHPRSYCAPYFPRVCCGKGAQHPPTLTRASEGRRAESESKSIDLRTKGEPSHTPAIVSRPHSPPLRRASEGRRPESESKSLICEPPGAKPPRTPAVVLRPLFSSGVLR